MSLKKLLIASTAAALVAGPAMADLLAPAALAVDIAEENDFAAGVVGLTGVVATGTPADSVFIQTDSPLPQADNLELTITIEGSGVFAPGFDPTTALFATGGGSVSGQIVSSGGPGTNEVVVLFDVDNATTGNATNELILAFGIAIAGCDSDVSLSINLETSSGQPIEGGTASLVEAATSPAEALDLFSCVDAYEVTIEPDATASVIALANGFTDFLGTGDMSIISDITVEVDTTAAVGATLAGLAAPTDIDELSFTATFTSDQNFDDPALAISVMDDVFGTSPAPAFDDTATPVFTFLGEIDDMGTDQVELTTAGGPDQTVPQQPVVSDAMITFDLAGLIDDEAVSIMSNGFDALLLEGAVFGPFDWVSDATSAVNTVFRGTGFDPDDVPSAIITLDNASLDDSLNTFYPLDLTGMISPGGQVVVNSQTIQDAVGQPFGLADVTITIFDDATFDFDRLYAAGGVISSHGGENAAVVGTQSVSD